MTKILVFGASSSQNSINKKLATYTANQLSTMQMELLDLNDFEMPIFSVDREQASGIPEEAIKFKQLIQESDGIIISFAEHNGSYSAAFKNIFDWASRVEKSMWLNKPMFLLATSPGGRGAQTVLAAAMNHYPHMGGHIVASFSMPSFHKNFDQGLGIKDASLLQQYEQQLQLFKNELDR